MNTLIDFALKNKYKKVEKLRGNLEKIKNLINWDGFLECFPIKKKSRGRPKYDKIIMMKIIFLQSSYGLSDEEVEYQCYNRLDFQKFLDFSDKVPDFTTIWRFREELAEANLLENIWDEMTLQLKNKNIILEKGVAQDARFIHADPGKKNSGMEGRIDAKTSRNRDGSWTKKGNKSIFGYKLHTKVDLKNKLIMEMGVTPANVHDGQIDLAKADEVNYRDRGYSGCPTKSKKDGTMKRGKLSVKALLRNKRISKKRCRIEHVYGFMTRSLKAGTTKLTTTYRVYAQQLFVCLSYNFHRFLFLNKA